MSSLKICTYCGKYEHDCQCLAARKIKKLERELAAANKGARINAMINKSLTEQLIHVRELLYKYHGSDCVCADCKTVAAMPNARADLPPR